MFLKGDNHCYDVEKRFCRLISNLVTAKILFPTFFYVVTFNSLQADIFSSLHAELFSLQGS